MFKMNFASLKKSLHSQDWMRLFATILLFFLISFIYHLLRPIKISIVVSQNHSDAKIIPFLKVWGILPGAVLFTFLYTFFSKRMHRAQVFYAMVSIFIAFYFLFISFLFPYREVVEMTSVADYLEQVLPAGVHGLAAMLRYWHYTLFYLFSELWGTVVLSMLFWGFVNETTSLENAKHQYGFFTFGANIATILSGQVGLYLSTHPVAMPFVTGIEKWDLSMLNIMSIVLICGVMILGLYWYVDRHAVSLDVQKHINKEKFTLTQSVKELFESKYLLFLCFIVFGYNLSFNLLDILWTNELRLKFINDTSGLAAYMSKITSINGLLAALLALFVTSRLVNRLGWKGGALATPIIVGITSTLFFIFIFNKNADTQFFTYSVAFSFLTDAVFWGAAQNSLTRAAKYSLFDATKEMAFIPLSKEQKRKGKAVIDGIGSRMGKSTGSVIFQVALLVFTSISNAVAYAACIVYVVLAIWIYSVLKLDQEVSKKEEEQTRAL